MNKTVEVECPNCGGTGIYHGFAEPEGVGVICINCIGTGMTTIHYVSFTGRKTRTGIEWVQYSRRSIVAGIGLARSSISYRDFLDGKLPSI